MPSWFAHTAASEPTWQPPYTTVLALRPSTPFPLSSYSSLDTISLIIPLKSTHSVRSPSQRPLIRHLKIKRGFYRGHGQFGECFNEGGLEQRVMLQSFVNFNCYAPQFLVFPPFLPLSVTSSSPPWCLLTFENSQMLCC